MISFLLWILTLFLLGAAAFPVLFWFFPHLADRGYGVAKPAGLLLFGYFYWILVTFGILPNNWTGVAAAFLLVLFVGFLAIRKVGWPVMKSWLYENLWLIAVVEVGFILLFGFFALMRAASPDITGTEKPMELAFINSILHSKVFPPADPWLSGYAISYYYFGYIIVAGIIRLTGTISGVGFNLAVSLWFAMAAAGSFSLVLNILSRIKLHNELKGQSVSVLQRAGWAVLGPIMLIFTANWEGFFELLHSRGLFWDASGHSAFWSWLDLKELTVAPSGVPGWFPTRPGGIWWWRASRVLQDYDFAGRTGEVIDEFPFFSLFLADLHPHVLSIPFVLLACNLALEFFIKASSGRQFRPGWMDVITYWTGSSQADKSVQNSYFPALEFWFAALIFGGLAFINIWDFPIYVGLASVGIVLARYLACGWNRQRILEFFECGLAFGFAGFLLYLPFYTGFASQAGGLLPSLVFFTRGKHLWLMFGVLFIPMLIGLISVIRLEKISLVIRKGLGKAAALLGILWTAMLILGLLITFAPALLGKVSPSLGEKVTLAAGLFMNTQGGGPAKDILLDSTLFRLMAPGSWLTLLLLTALIWGIVLALRDRFQQLQAATIQTDSTAKNDDNAVNTLPFLLLLATVGLGLVMFPEFFYLRDQFGTRMNTIFKFYYQAWILWSAAASVFVFIFWNNLKGITGWVARLLFILSMFAGFLYPFYALVDRFDSFSLERLNLDGSAYFSMAYPAEMEAVNYLSLAPDGTVAEAVGGSYTGYARISTLSGQPTVLGWPGHESQWRGGAIEIGTREPDIKTLYQTSNWEEALRIIQKYQIRYIYIGSLETNTYRVNEEKFKTNLSLVFNRGSVVIYEVPSQLLITPKK